MSDYYYQLPANLLTTLKTPTKLVAKKFVSKSLIFATRGEKFESVPSRTCVDFSVSVIFIEAGHHNFNLKVKHSSISLL